MEKEIYTIITNRWCTENQPIVFTERKWEYVYSILKVKEEGASGVDPGFL